MRKMAILRLAAAQLLSAFMLFWLTVALLKLMYISAGGMPLWPIEGVTVALMLGPLRRHPLLTLAVTKIAVMLAGLMMGNPPLLVVSVVLIYAVASYGVYFSVKIFIDEDGFFKSKGLIYFIISSFFASIFIGIIQSFLQKIIMGTPLLPTFFMESTANAVGLAVITPLVVILTSRPYLIADKRLDMKKSAIILLMYMALSGGVFWQGQSPLLYLIPLGLMLVAYKSDLAVVALAVLWTVISSMVATLMGYGPFELVADVTNRIYALQVFWAVITATTLPVAALMSEHARLKTS